MVTATRSGVSPSTASLLSERLRRKLSSAEHHESHPVHIGGAKHATHVLRPARPVQPNGCESFRHRCLLPDFQSIASTLSWNVCRLFDSHRLLLFIEPSGVPVCSFCGVSFLVTVLGCFARRGDETGQRWELGNSSVGRAFGPGILRHRMADTVYVPNACGSARARVQALSTCLRKDRATGGREGRMPGENRLATERLLLLDRTSGDLRYDRGRHDHPCPGPMPPSMRPT